MKWLLLFILIINVAEARVCDFRKKGVKEAIPEIPSTIQLEDNWQSAYNDVFNVLCHNLKAPNAFFRGYRAHPGPPYKAAYLWDTAFITQVWLHWDTHIAEELIHYVLKFRLTVMTITINSQHSKIGHVNPHRATPHVFHK